MKKTRTADTVVLWAIQQKSTESAAERVSSDSPGLVFLLFHVFGRPDYKLLTE